MTPSPPPDYWTQPYPVKRAWEWSGAERDELFHEYEEETDKDVDRGWE